MDLLIYLLSEAQVPQTLIRGLFKEKLLFLQINVGKLVTDTLILFSYILNFKVTVCICFQSLHV